MTLLKAMTPNHWTRIINNTLCWMWITQLFPSMWISQRGHLHRSMMTLSMSSHRCSRNSSPLAMLKKWIRRTYFVLSRNVVLIGHHQVSSPWWSGFVWLTRAQGQALWPLMRSYSMPPTFTHRELRRASSIFSSLLTKTKGGMSRGFSSTSCMLKSVSTWQENNLMKYSRKQVAMVGS